MRYIVLTLASALLLAGCRGQNPTRSQAYVVDSNGGVRTSVRAAMDPGTEPGPVEIIGINLPFIGTGLTAKAGLIWDGTAPGVITIPVPVTTSSAPMSQRTVELPVPQSALTPAVQCVPKVQAAPAGCR